MKRQSNENSNGNAKIQTRFLINIIFFLLASLVFTLIYTQEPLFTSNQNQYFLHGMAQAGMGSLPLDWLANTKEPSPVFTALVKWTFLLLEDPTWFYFYFTLIAGIYICSLIGILVEIFSLKGNLNLIIVVITILLFLHSAFLRYGLGKFLGSNWMFFFDGGVAGQRILGLVFQPSVFGVLLITSVFLFMKGHPSWAAILAALAASIHPTYLLTAALLILGYMFAIFQEEKNIWKSVKIGSLALLVVIPILVYIIGNFWGSPNAAQARDILINIRIPHHADAEYWLDASVAVKLAIIGLALFFIRQTKYVFYPMLTVTLGSIFLSIYQIISKDTLLALVFPWRASTLLVPISSGVLTVTFSKWIYTNVLTHLSAKNLRIICALIISFLCAAGAWAMYHDQIIMNNRREKAMIQWIRNNTTDKDRFLIPTDLDFFRTSTLRAAYVDYFAIPYNDEDVANWYHRVLSANKFYDTGDCAELNDIRGSQVFRYIVTEQGIPQPDCWFTLPVYSDEYFRIYQVDYSSQ